MVLDVKASMLRRNWWPILACAVAFVGGLVVARSSMHLAPFGWLGVLYGVVFAPLFFAWRSFPLGTPVTIQATAQELTVKTSHERTLGTERVISAEHIVETKLSRRGGYEPRLDLGLRGGETLSLRLSEQDAASLVHVLGARRSAFALRPRYLLRYLASFVALAALSLVAALASGNLSLFLFSLPSCAFWSVFVALVLGIARGRVVVGVDGFTTRWFRRDRFTAYRTVARIITGDSSVRVELVGKKAKRFFTVESPNTNAERNAEAESLAKHLTEALLRSRQRAAEVPSLVQRGSRTAAEWLSALDAIARGGDGGYRVAAVSPELLASVADDPSATSDTRLGAATALLRAGHEAQRVHVRIAAEACAEPDLRAALLALAEAHDDEATCAALATLRR